jgi:hypothetical protein
VAAGAGLDPGFHRIGNAVGRRCLRARSAGYEHAFDSNYAENYLHRINLAAEPGRDPKISTHGYDDDARIVRARSIGDGKYLFFLQLDSICAKCGTGSCGPAGKSGLRAQKR